MKVDRRAVLAGGGAVAAAGTVGWVATREAPIKGSVGGADMARGHRLRDGKFPVPTREEATGVIIVGGGVAGLAAGWTLAEAGFDNFSLLELEDETGGNARSGTNAVSAFPLGAHYLPVPNREARALRHMLTKFGMITGADADGAPAYDSYQLTADMEERLLWQGKWQEGLIPQTGLSAADRADLAAFDAAIAGFSKAVGTDGKPAFALPIAYSSSDPTFTDLDRQSFTAWLDAKGWKSKILRAHLRYGCRDDYGCELEHVSAWVGIHYFAGRRGWAASGAGNSQLTWPEGNARLTRAMAVDFKDRIKSGRIAFSVKQDGDGVVVDSFDLAENETVRTKAKAAILALPHFIAARIALGLSAKGFTYAPWLVANVTVDRLPKGDGAKLAWDNVAWASESLGYVVATHQSLQSAPPASVLTWYMPLSKPTPAVARKLLMQRPADAWRRIVTDDLLMMNPDLKGAIRSVDLWHWGHAMVRPEPGFVWGLAAGARASAKPPLFLAHSDMSGLSLFEEAHYRGVDAAEGAMRHLNHRHESLI
jgi:NAD(P)-binding Rossmann-like domain